MTARFLGLIAGTWLVLAPLAGWAQSATSGAIAGAVKDATGAVLPGVTVEAGSPALIEKVRTAVTDDRGEYKIVELRPGTYTVTFTLAGFSAYKREGIALTAGFTAAADAEMRVGALEETVTVTGASPVVDVQNVRTQTVLSKETLDALPSGKTFQSLTTLTLGAVNTSGDVGGTNSENCSTASYHGGSRDTRYTQDGMKFDGLDGAAGCSHVSPNQVAYQETAIETSGMSAEAETGGIQFNLVPKDGGNEFSIYSNLTYSSGRFQTSNLNDELRARGLTTQQEIKKLYDYGFGVGGPIRRDKLWFYVATRWWGSQTLVPNNYFNKSTNPLFYEPDLSRPAYLDIFQSDPAGIRLTWQVASSHKLSIFNTYQQNCYCFYAINSSARSPEAASSLRYWPGHAAQVSWNHPATNRLLFEAGATYYGTFQKNSPPDGVSQYAQSVTELSTGYIYGATSADWLNRQQYGYNKEVQHNQRFAVSYVTGSHAFKTGVTLMEAPQTVFTDHNPVSYQFLRGAPVQLTQYATPFWVKSVAWPNLGTFVQDQWTVSRLTLNLGLRHQWLRAHNPEWHIPAGPFVAARDFARQDNVPNWKDLLPRLGAAYDLFGNGKTAVKASLGRYTFQENTDNARRASPVVSIVGSSTRTWTDANGNFVPDCELTSTAANGECGALSNRLFGTINQITRYSPDVEEGFNIRPFDWQGSLVLQQELRTGVALTVGYFRTSAGNFGVGTWGSVGATIDNLAVTPEDFSEYCITAPVDPRLPDGGGNQLCGLYDVNPSKFGQVNNLIQHASKYGKRTQVYNGMDIGLTARFAGGGLIQGGVSTGRTVTDNCAIIDSPEAARPGFCKVTPPLSAATQVKFSVVYPLPWDFQASTTFQNLPGIQRTANYVARNAEIAPSLGRNLAAGANATTTVALIPPSTMFEDRLTQLDVRLARKLRVGRARMQAMFDIYNILNSSAVLSIRNAYGPTWLQPTNVLTPRYAKFGMQLDF